MAPTRQPFLAFARPEDDTLELVMGKLPASDLISIPDIASAMGIANNVVREWIDDGRLPTLPCGAGATRAHHKVSKNTFRRFLEMKKQGLL
jgi:hypothetical protein